MFELLGIVGGGPGENRPQVQLYALQTHAACRATALTLPIGDLVTRSRAADVRGEDKFPPPDLARRNLLARFRPVVVGSLAPIAATLSSSQVLKTDIQAYWRF
jgi:hypothetical protein